MGTDPPGERPEPSDHRVILGNTGQNVLGLGIGAVATFVAQVVMTRELGRSAFGLVTFTTQFAFISAAASRFGMDVANVRLVATLVGKGQATRSRTLVRRSVAIAASVSVALGVAVVLAAPWLADRFTSASREGADAFRAAGVTIPLAALAFTWMGATRGLKVMRPTLFAQWIAQPIGWIVLTIVFWAWASASASAAGWAFAASWGVALAVAWFGWEARARRLRDAPGSVDEGVPEERTGALLRFGAFRAPATLFSQLLFWTDLFVLSIVMRPAGLEGAEQVGVYSAVLRAGQSLFLFLTSVSLTFSPFVADLHHRGEGERLDQLYKSVTRWTLTATIPVLLLLAVLPGPVLRIFGPGFAEGDAALRILIVGMIVPVMVGTVGFILIMAGRTGWDLVVYVASFGIDVAVAWALARPDVLGISGAAIAQAVTLSFSAVARLMLVRRFLDIWPFDATYIRLLMPTAVGALAMFGLAALVPDARWGVELLVAGGGGGLAYLVAVLAVGVLPEERTALVRLVRGAVGGT